MGVGGHMLPVPCGTAQPSLKGLILASAVWATHLPWRTSRVQGEQRV